MSQLNIKTKIGAKIPDDVFAKIVDIVASEKVIAKSDASVLLPDDFEWAACDEWKSKFEDEGHESHPLQYCNKAEILIHDVNAIYHSKKQLAETTRSESGKKVKFLASHDSCSYCKKFDGKVFAAAESPISCIDTHPGCRCCIIIDVQEDTE